MSFSDIILPPLAIGEIYKNHLVQTGDEQKKHKSKLPMETQDTPPEALQYLGKNLKSILVFVNYPEEVFLPPGQLEFLGKILNACNLNIGDIAIVNTARQQKDHSSLIHELQPKSILIFGTHDGLIPGNEAAAFFTPVRIDEFSLINAPALEKLSQQDHEGKQLKSLFWNSLKQFFNL